MKKIIWIFLVIIVIAVVGLFFGVKHFNKTNFDRSIRAAYIVEDSTVTVVKRKSTSHLNPAVGGSYYVVFAESTVIGGEEVGAAVRSGLIKDDIKLSKGWMVYWVGNNRYEKSGFENKIYIETERKNRREVHTIPFLYVVYQGTIFKYRLIDYTIIVKELTREETLDLPKKIWKKIYNDQIFIIP